MVIMENKCIEQSELVFICFYRIGTAVVIFLTPATLVKW